MDRAEPAGSADQDTIDSLAPWFYEFDLGALGRTTSALPLDVAPIHETRLRMVTAAIEEHLRPNEIVDATCLDIGCHEGFYSVEMVKLGFRHVTGVDIRAASLRRARFVAGSLGLANLDFRELDAEAVSPATTGTHDLTLFLGLLYHLENPMLCLRKLSAVTRRFAVIETQVIDDVDGETEWGSQRWTFPYRGVLALIDESAEFERGNRETGSVPLVTCPSVTALTQMLLHAGFRTVSFVEPPDGAYEQLARKKRVVCIAGKE